MKHSSSQIIFRHWNELRDQRAVPERADVDPAQIRGALADSFILSFEPKGTHQFRLAGTRLCALFGHELKDTALVSLWRPADRAALDKLVTTAVDDSIGVVAAVTASTDGYPDVDLELLLLPLKHGGKTHLRLIGSMAPLVVPHWLGVQPVRSLTLGDYRYIGHVVMPPRLQVAPSIQPPDRVKHGLAVYDGGRS
jgi:hypothetical protein